MTENGHHRPGAGPEVPPGIRNRGGIVWGDLRQRLLSALVMVVLGAVLITVSGIWLRLGVATLCGGMLWELARMTAWRHAEYYGPRRPVLFGIIGGVALYLMLLIPGNWAVALALVPVALGYPGTHAHVRRAFVFFTLAILLAGYALVVVREAMGLGTALWLIATVVLSDVLGYFAGRKFGGPKLWPAISPNKTWSGTIAGWIGAFVLAVILAVTGQAGWIVVLAGPLLAMAGQAGDIVESWIKRRVGVKDSSDIIPGHGGLMDRFDAMSGTFLMAFFLMLIGLLPRIGG